MPSDDIPQNMTELLASNVVCFQKYLLNSRKESGLSCVVWMSEFPHIGVGII